MGIGTVVWDSGKVTVEAVGLEGDAIMTANHVHQPTPAFTVRVESDTVFAQSSEARRGA